MIKPKNFWLPELSLFGDLLKKERFFINIKKISKKNFSKKKQCHFKEWILAVALIALLFIFEQLINFETKLY